MSPPPSAKGARRRDPEPSEPRGPGPQPKTCSSSCLSWLHPLRSWSLRQTRGGSIRGGLVIREEEKLRVKIAAQIVVRDQLLYCLNHELAAGQPRFMVGCEP